MADLDEFDDENDDYSPGNQNQGPADLRRQLDKLKRDLKAKEKALADKDEQLGTLSVKARQGDLASLFQKQGIDPKFAKFYPSDSEVSESDLAKWVKENSDVYAFKAKTGDSGGRQAADNQDGQDDDRGDEVDDADLDPKAGLGSNDELAGSMNRLIALEGLAQPGSSEGINKLLSDYKKADPKSIEDVLEVFRANGINFNDQGGYRY